MSTPGYDEETSFTEFRRKIRAAEVLSASLERLMTQIHFSGKVSVVVQNGRVLKSGYEEAISATIHRLELNFNTHA